MTLNEQMLYFFHSFPLPKPPGHYFTGKYKNKQNKKKNKKILKKNKINKKPRIGPFVIHVYSNVTKTVLSRI